MQIRIIRLQRPADELVKRRGWLFTQETFPAWAKKRTAPEELADPDGGLVRRAPWLQPAETFPGWARKKSSQDNLSEIDGGLIKRVAPFLQAQSTETFPGWLRKANPTIADTIDDSLRRPAWFQNVIVAVIPPLPCPYLPSRLLTDSTSSPVRGSAPADTFSSRPAPDADSAPARKTECR